MSVRPSALTGPLLAFCLAVPACSSAAGLRHRFHISPGEIRSVDTRVLAERLVERIHRACESSGREEAERRPAGKDADLLMMVPQEAFASISRHGFLNQHVTLTTRGFNHTRERFLTEQELAMLRLPYSHQGRKFLPKYALLDLKRSDMGTYHLPSRYGGAAVVFKRRVLDRATWTYADSLDFSQKTGRFGQGGWTNPVLPRTARYRRKSIDRNACVNYCEAQIWGELTLEDVDYIMVRATEPVLSTIVETGLPIYRFFTSTSSAAPMPAGRMALYTRGEQVSPGRAQRKHENPVIPAPAGLEESVEFASLTDAELVRRYSVETDTASPVVMPRRIRLLGEISTRPKGDVILRALEDATRSGDPMARALALYGLSELPSRDFKPHLLTALEDPNPAVVIEAVALAADMLADPEVAAALNALQQGISQRKRKPSDKDASDIQEWLDRLDRASLCQ